MPSDVSRETAAPIQAAAIFGDRLPLATAYAALLSTTGAERGLIGPREVPRLWERHLLNCAVLTEGIAVRSSVADVGSGAGLPGIPVAIRRPDLRVTLIEPLLRRAAFLGDVVDALQLENVAVVRERAEALHGRQRFQVVASRAVAPLAKLLGWCVPLTTPDGVVLAMKGAAAAAEVEDAASVLASLGVQKPEIVHMGSDVLGVPSTVVRVRPETPPALRSTSRRPGTPTRRSRPRHR